MPPRYSYWTILAGGLPTAFRAAEREDLLATFARLKEKHPDAELRWFAKGRLWDSPEAARAAVPDTRERRGPDWRPGGKHADPRQPYKDAKKARNANARRVRFENRERGRPLPDAVPGSPSRQGDARPFRRDEPGRHPGTGPNRRPSGPRGGPASSSSNRQNERSRPATERPLPPAPAPSNRTRPWSSPDRPKASGRRGERPGTPFGPKDESRSPRAVPRPPAHSKRPAGNSNRPPRKGPRR